LIYLNGETWPGNNARNISRDQPKPPDDNARTEEARRVVDDYITALREILQKLRKLFN
jgi:hypothetical protein